MSAEMGKFQFFLNKIRLLPDNSAPASTGCAKQMEWGAMSAGSLKFTPRLTRWWNPFIIVIACQEAAGELLLTKD